MKVNKDIVNAAKKLEGMSLFFKSGYTCFPDGGVVGKLQEDGSYREYILVTREKVGYTVDAVPTCSFYLGYGLTVNTPTEVEFLKKTAEFTSDGGLRNNMLLDLQRGSALIEANDFQWDWEFERFSEALKAAREQKKLSLQREKKERKEADRGFGLAQKLDLSHLKVS